MVNRILAAVAALVVPAAAARADLVVDDFSTPTVSYSLNTPGASFTDTRGTGSGFTRVADVALTAFDEVPSGGALGGGRFSLGTASGTTAVARLAYTADAPLDLSAPGTALNLTFGFADLNVPFSVRVTDANGSTDLFSGRATTGGGSYSFPLAGFSGVNLTRVRFVTIGLNQDADLGPLFGPSATSVAVTSADFTLTNVRFTTPTPPPPSVPAPPAAALLALAAPVLGVWRARRRKVAA